jgi:hypothetical protein
MTEPTELMDQTQIESFFVQEQELQPRDLIRLRVDFAIRSMLHIQELVRFMDQKSGLVLTAVGILTTAQGAFLLRMLSMAAVSPLQQGVRAAAIGCALIYILTAFSVIFAGTKVFTPSVAPRRPNSKAPGLLFPLAILQKQGGNEDTYHQRIMQAMPSDLLHDLSNQIVEISNIFKAKSRYLDSVFWRFRLLCVLWLTLMLLLVLSNLLP